MLDKDIQAAIRSCEDRIDRLQKVEEWKAGRRQRQRAIELEELKKEALLMMQGGKQELTNAEAIRRMSIQEMARKFLFFCPSLNVIIGPKYTGLSGKYYDTAEEVIVDNESWLSCVSERGIDKGCKFCANCAWFNEEECFCENPDSHIYTISKNGFCYHWEDEE